jgi:hypothetical protein
MRLLNQATCQAIGHEPHCYLARLAEDLGSIWGKYVRCSRCDSDASVKIHTQGLLDFL